MSEEEIEQQLKKSRRQTKDERYEYINSHFNQTNYAMKLEKYALKLHKENSQLKDRINKAVEYIENNSLYDEEYDYNYEEEIYLSGIDDEVAKKDLLSLLKGDKE